MVLRRSYSVLTDAAFTFLLAGEIVAGQCGITHIANYNFAAPQGYSEEQHQISYG